MSRYAGLLGIIVFLSIAYLFSTNRRAIRLKTVLWGLGLQFLFAWIVIRFDLGPAYAANSRNSCQQTAGLRF